MASPADDYIPTWWSWRPVLGSGVRFDGERIHDDHAGASVRLGERALGVLRAVDGCATVRELERQAHGASALLLELNRAHLVNFARGPRQRWTELCALLRGGRRARLPAVSARIPVSSGSARAVLVAVLRALGSHVVSTPWVLLTWLGGLLLACAAAASTGAVILWLSLIACSGYVAHEFGHAWAACRLSGPTYVSSSARGVSVHARLRGPLQVRIFALAGPLLPAALGLCALGAAPWMDESRWIPALLLAHLVFLVPPFDDGLLLLRGGPSIQDLVEGVSHEPT